MGLRPKPRHLRKNVIMKKRSSNDKVVRRKTKKSTKSSKELIMNQTKYIGMDVHVATTVIAIRNSDGKVVTEAIIETKAPAQKKFSPSLGGRKLSLTFSFIGRDLGIADALVNDRAKASF